MLTRVGRKIVTRLRKELDEAEERDYEEITDDDLRRAIHVLSMYVERYSWTQDNLVKRLEKLEARHDR